MDDAAKLTPANREQREEAFYGMFRGNVSQTELRKLLDYIDSLEQQRDAHPQAGGD